MLDFNHPEIAFVTSILRETARLARQIQEDMAVMNLTKSDLSPVTVADFAIQAVAAYRLSQCFPGAVLVAEERAARLREPENAPMLALVAEYVCSLIPGASPEQVCDWIDRGAGEPGDRFWTLDPIDGTKGYRRGGQYVVALAVIEAGRVALGGLACPNLDEAFLPGVRGPGVLTLARRGCGTWGMSLDFPAETATPLRVSDCRTPTAARLLRSYESGHTDVSQLEAIAARLGIAEANMTLMDSQAKYAALASGQAELLFRLLSPGQPDYRERIWDQAAGSIVVEEAGGKVSDLRGRPLDFSKGRTLEANIGVFASNGHLHEVGLETIAALVPGL